MANTKGRVQAEATPTTAGGMRSQPGLPAQGAHTCTGSQGSQGPPTYTIRVTSMT